MDLRKTMIVASEALKGHSIAHALIGGFALASHQINRATADIDFLAEGSKRDLILDSLTEVGFETTHASAEVLQFSGVGQLDILLANRPLTMRMIREAMVFDRVPVRVLRAEDLIGLKVQAYQNDRSRELRDKADIQALINSSSNLDWDRIKSYADLFGEWPVISALRVAR